MKVAWLIQNLVPYHHARFEAFAKTAGVEAHLIQVTDRDDFRVLEFKPREKAYELHTLFPGCERASIAMKQIQGKLDELLARMQPDCICVSGWGMVIGQLMHAWALRNRVPVVMFSESTAHDEPRVVWREWIKASLVRSASAALVGGTLHRQYMERLGMPADRIFDGHNAVDSSHFAKPVESRPELFPSGLNEKGFFATCARFGEKKNLPRLVRAYARYIDRCRSEQVDALKLAIAGDGPQRADIESEIEHAQLQGQVVMLGSVGYDAMPWFYQNCKAYVHASTTEQWGLVVNEAIAAGAPLALSRRCGCAPNLLDEGQNGFGFDPFSEEEITDALLLISTLSTDQEEMFSARSRAISKEWEADRFASNLVSAVNCAMKHRPTKSSWLAKLLLVLLMKREKLD